MTEETTVDFSPTELLKEQILTQVRDFASAAEADLQRFATDIARDAAMAAASGDHRQLLHVKAQLGLLAAQRQIELSRTGMTVLITTVEVGVSLLTKLLTKV